MKKILLLSAAATVALTGLAQAKVEARPVAANLGEKVQVTRVTESVKATQATEWKAPMLREPAANVQYKRPQGSFYGVGHAFEDGVYTGSYYVGPLQVRPYEEVTFANISTVKGKPKWTFEGYEGGEKQTFTSNDTDLTYEYHLEYVNSPVLSYANIYDFGKAYYRTTDAGDNGVFNIGLASVCNLEQSYGAHMPVSPKFMGYCVRQGAGNYGYTYYTGAGEDGEGCWFGSGSPYDALGTRFEEPLKPYAINGAYIQCQGYTAEEVELPVKVYEVISEGGPEEVYDEATGEMVTKNLPAELGELICEGLFTIPASQASEEEGGDAYLLYSPFYFDGDLEWTPEISTSIVVVVENINDPRLSGFTFLLGNDSYDEGWGELAYIGYAISDTTGEPSLWGLTNFFKNAVIHSALTIWLDATTPFIMQNYNGLPDSFDMPVEGGDVEFAVKDEEGNLQMIPLELYSYQPSDGVWDVTLADGEDLPEWLTVECSDLNATDAEGNEEFSGLVDVYITADALPEGMTGRTATIKFWYPGASYLFTVNQGEVSEGNPGDANGDGLVDATDISYLIAHMLGETLDNFNAQNAELTGDNAIDAADIAKLIAIMLGE